MDIGGVNVPWWAVLKDSVYDTTYQHRLPCFPSPPPVPTEITFQEIYMNSIHVCLWKNSGRTPSLGCSAQVVLPPPLHDWHVCLESCCEPVIVQERFASEIKEASAFWKNIGSHSMSFQNGSQVQHFLSSAITAAFCVQFK